MNIKLMVCGSRSITNKTWIFAEIESYVSLLFESKRIESFEELEIIHGGASGVDRIAGEWAKSKGCKIKVVPADWNTFGRGAGIIRNKQMVDMADRVLVLWDGNSKGTKSDIKFAEEAGKTPYIRKYLY